MSMHTERFRIRGGISASHAITAVSAWLLGLAFAILLLPSYYLFLGANLVISFIAIAGLVLLIGQSGQVSLGHGAFVGLGAYVCAIAMEKAGVSYLFAVPVAGLVSFGIGYLFGYPALRLEGMYLALATFALALAFPQIVKFRAFSDLTGGTMGMVLPRPDSPLPSVLSVDEWLFLFTASWGLGMYLLAVGVLNSKLALAWRALSDHRLAAETMGIDQRTSRNAAFAVSAAYAGISGALGVVLTQFISPDTFGFFLSLTLLVGAVVGGIHSLFGAIIGAAFIQFIPTFAEGISKAAPWAVYGVILLIVISLAPFGIAGASQRLGAAALGVIRRR